MRALQAHGRLQVVSFDSVVDEFDICCSATGNFTIVTLEHMKPVKGNAIVDSIGRFSNDTDMAGLEGFPGVTVENIKPLVDQMAFLDEHGVRAMCRPAAYESGSLEERRRGKNLVDEAERWVRVRHPLGPN